MNVLNKQFNAGDLLYTIPREMHDKERIRIIIKEHPEIKFASLAAVDLMGNDTDEKIPIENFIKNYDSYLEGGLQTDGSSVVLPGVATLNDGKVNLMPDISVNWFVDHNYEHIDSETNLPVSTLRIPSFLIHNGVRIDSRSVLQMADEYLKNKIIEIIKKYPDFKNAMGFSVDDIEDIIYTAATELEFWVKTPDCSAEVEELSISQVLKEQYWKRTKGNVRTSLEESLLLLKRYGLEPEMGHKEVGGVKARLTGDGKFSHIMEQLEIDWEYDSVMQASDNELMARILIKETFRKNGLEVTFMAKPLEGVAGNGEHTHINIKAKLKDDRMVNLFAPKDMKKDYLSPIGWGALMGFLKNYKLVNPFITNTNDAINRLKPGYEAPVCVVASIGEDKATPSRNRTVLLGLIRDMANKNATRFEIRSPNPHTNTYLALAATSQAMLDGIEYALGANKSTEDLEKEFSKQPEEESDYLCKERAYRSEKDVFEYYTSEQRNLLFGNVPATVWEVLENISKTDSNLSALKAGDVFSQKILDSFIRAISHQWIMELSERTIGENVQIVRSCVKLHTEIGSTDYDDELWSRISNLKKYLMKDSLDDKSLFSRIRAEISNQDYKELSNLQIEMYKKINELRKLYMVYKRNIIDYNF